MSTVWPAMTAREIRQSLADEREGRHWGRVQCWCGVEHQPEIAGLLLPPWAEAPGRLNAAPGTAHSHAVYCSNNPLSC